ncbi:hypothetical protein HDU99_006771, partial [Rhizoclosmatium hyalinum]
MFATDPTFMGCAIDLIASKSSADSAKFKLSNYGPDPGAIDRENLEAWLSYQENCQLSLNKGLPLPAKPEFDPNQMKLGRMISEAEMQQNGMDDIFFTMNPDDSNAFRLLVYVNNKYYDSYEFFPDKAERRAEISSNPVAQ